MPRSQSFRRRLLFGAVALVVVVTFLLRRTGVIPGDEASGFDPEAFQNAPVLSTEEAMAREGGRAIVCGRVVNAVFARETSGRPTFLNLDRPYPDQPFDIVIWGRDRRHFQHLPERFYLNESICVAGEIAVHEGVPRIEANVPGQIRLQVPPEHPAAPR